MIVHALIAVAMLAVSAGPAIAQTRAVAGQTGVLGEWELTATVTAQPDRGTLLWTGPMSLRHVGFCGVDGPETKSGELQLRFSDPPRDVVATVLIDGVKCSFNGRLKDNFDGVLTCPDRRNVPMMLTVD